MTIDKTTKTENPERARAEKDRDCPHMLTYDGMCVDCFAVVTPANGIPVEKMI